MDIKELKNQILNNTLDDSFMIWVLEDESSNIIANQYINRICENKNLNRKVIEKIEDIPDASFTIDDNLYIIYSDKDESNEGHNNCIVLCKSSKNKNNVKIPKIVDWQITDYVLDKVKGLSEDEINWLLPQYNGNYFRLLSDIDKIKIFPESAQKNIFHQILEEGQLKDISNLTIWDLTNAITRKDTKMITEVLKVINYIDIEPLGLITTLYRSFKNVINVSMNPNATAEELGLTGKQYFVIKKYNCNIYSKEKLIQIMKLLTDMEYRFKFESIELNQVIDYMIVKIIGD